MADCIFHSLACSLKGHPEPRPQQPLRVPASTRKSPRMVRFAVINAVLLVRRYMLHPCRPVPMGLKLERRPTAAAKASNYPSLLQPVADPLWNDITVSAYLLVITVSSSKMLPAIYYCIAPYESNHYNIFFLHSVPTYFNGIPFSTALLFYFADLCLWSKIKTMARHKCVVIKWSPFSSWLPPLDFFSPNSSFRTQASPQGKLNRNFIPFFLKESNVRSFSKVSVKLPLGGLDLWLST